MNNELKHLSQAHLHAYVDKELNRHRRGDVTDFIKTHPNLTSYLKDYHVLNDKLHKMFDGVVNEPLPENILNVLVLDRATKKSLQMKQAKKGSAFRNTIILVFLGMVFGGFIGLMLQQSSHLEIISKAKAILSQLITSII